MAEYGNTRDSMWRWWPCFVGGFCGPPLGRVLASWAPPHVAVGLAFFIMWVVVGLLFAVLPPKRGWSLMRWAGGGALGAIVAGALAFAFQ
jgi:hypothetical protein